MKSEIGLMTVILALTACGGTPEGSAGSGETDAQSTGTSNGSFPTTGDPSAGSNSDSGTTTDRPTSGNSESNSNSGVTTSATATATATETSASETATSADPTSASATEPDPGTTTTTTTGDTTGGESTMGLSDSDSASTSTSTTGTTGGGESTTGSDETTTGGGMEECDSVLDATIRDFKVSHPDFEKYGGNVAYKGLVKTDLGADMKPVYAAPGPTPQTSGPDAFKQWYNDTPDINQAIPIQLTLTEIMPGIFQYKSDAFFPIDNQGFGNENFNHNFAFTTEIHTQFIYNGGEVFTFTGDDDMWMFINKKLAIDLGGLHPPDTQTINLDAESANLGITKGVVYTMDIFHAERHSDGSNFRIDTTIGCFIPQ